VVDGGLSSTPMERCGEFLFEIIMRRYETRSTMMTSNRPLEDGGKLIGDVPSATAILDRFLHHAEIVTLNGRSYRLRSRSKPAQQSSAPEQSGQPTDSAREPKPAISPASSEDSEAAPRRRTKRSQSEQS